ncbi:double zinc ribbon domain-containing protein [Clostridium vincentii]|uniref:Double zinc ribbon n=1 Tax=Clostridium vincentii TaxID=52704 RepID=A0A2T0B8J1_9CLOT|nr:zinc ribbon domain-containing protein [Clostridium vincentii]PRR80211.1 Double zinc ribbon [Clostridium vincentii]
MKCSNCNAEISDNNQKFCMSCGKEIIKEQVIDEIEEVVIEEQHLAKGKCDNCNKPINKGERYCTSCGEDLKNGEEGTSDFNSDPYMNMAEAKEQLGQLKGFIMKNKKISGIVGAIIAVFVVSLIVFGIMSGMPFSENKIKKELVGKSVNVYGSTITLTDENLESLEVINRETIKKSYDDVNIELEIKLDKAVVTTEGSVSFGYYDNEWTYSSCYITDIKSIDTDSKPEDAIKDSLKEQTLYEGYSTEIDGNLITEINNIECGELNSIEGQDFTADIKLSNGIAYQEATVNGIVVFDFDEEVWAITEAEVTDIGKSIKEEKVDEDALKEMLLDALVEESSFHMERTETNYGGSFKIEKDDISDFTVKNYVLQEGNKIRAEIEGIAKSDKVSEMAFSGTMIVSSELLDSSYYNDIDVKITSVKIEDPTIEEIKSGILDETVSKTEINYDISNSFKEVKRDKSEVTIQYINGTLTVDGKEVQAQVVMSFEEGYSDEPQSWKVSGVYAQDSSYYKAF